MISLKVMNPADITIYDLDRFIRSQHTSKMKYVKYKSNGTLQSDRLFEKACDFNDEWDLMKRREVCQYLKTVDGTVVYAYDENQVVGFCNIDHKLYGDYMVMPYIHVSKPYRGRGIAKKMFYMICEEAAKQGAQKLYISAHPAVETYGFYQSVGCVLAKKIIKEMLDKEPADLQLERTLI